MQKIKTKRKNKILLVLGISIIIIYVVICTLLALYNSSIKTEEEKKINHFLEIQEEVQNDNFKKINKSTTKQDQGIYIAVIEIPKISLKKGLYRLESKLNNVDKNIQILKGSEYPNIDNSNFILAGHSGTGRNAFFNNIHKLKNNDIVYVFFNGKKYTYEVKCIYDIKKTGTAKIIRDKGVKTVTLITCKGDNQQTIIIANLLKEELLNNG